MTNKKIPCGFLDTTGEVGGRKRDRQPDCPAPVCQRELHEMLDVINHQNGVSHAALTRF